LHPTAANCRQIKLKTPILDNKELARLRYMELPGFRSITIPILFPVAEGGPGLERALEEVCRKASQAIAEGYTYIILSDRGIDQHLASIPALLATAGVHHHLVRTGARTKVGLVIETGEAREVHHMALLIGFSKMGISTIQSYRGAQIFEAIGLDKSLSTGISPGPPRASAVLVLRLSPKR
jgi:glutamate synthase (NADPH/NADH) large chain